MAKRTRNPPKMWVYSPPRPPKPRIPDGLKAELDARARALVETTLKPRAVKPPPEHPQFNYIDDVYTRWYRSALYFCAHYVSPFPDAIESGFESRFARMEYAGDERFRLAFMRHTGQWIEVYHDQTIDQGLAAIKDDPYFAVM